MEEKQFFASSRADISEAASLARKELISELKTGDSVLHNAWTNYCRDTEGV